MEDSIDVILEDQRSSSSLPLRLRGDRVFTLTTGAVLAGLYGFWAAFCMPGLKVPFRLKVPFLPSSNGQIRSVMQLLEGRRGKLADLGSGDGRLVFAACSAGFQCTGFEINPMLLVYSRCRAWWMGIPHSHAKFIHQDFWKTDLSGYTNVIAFLTPAAMLDLEEKLLSELGPGARVVLCRFPFPCWPHSGICGKGDERVWAYDVTAERDEATKPSLPVSQKTHTPQNVA